MMVYDKLLEDENIILPFYRLLFSFFITDICSDWIPIVKVGLNIAFLYSSQRYNSYNSYGLVAR